MPPFGVSARANAKGNLGRGSQRKAGVRAVARRRGEPSVQGHRRRLPGGASPGIRFTPDVLARGGDAWYVREGGAAWAGSGGIRALAGVFLSARKKSCFSLNGHVRSSEGRVVLRWREGVRSQPPVLSREEEVAGVVRFAFAFGGSMYRGARLLFVNMSASEGGRAIRVPKSLFPL